ncbi:helix-turn-helix domain-containing protein [Specibacter sp. NPDC057265]|uniref:helix-turn-helix domain-containing protein n=1 Tax=Specibacter sp. NPDC057265 TaxID=3346075 RepID=UPI003636A9CB
MSIYTQNSSHTGSNTTQWLTPTDICRELQIPLQTFYQWRARGVGPHAYRIGKHLRVSQSDYETWLSLQSDPE